MTDNCNVKAASENTCNKIKAIYPHITVSGDVDKPYYSIDWYDIEKQTMYRGYSSYNLPLVRKWLQENFEVVEVDIDDLINRQKAENEALKAEEKAANHYCKNSCEPKYKANVEGLTNAVKFLNEQLTTAKAEAFKEFANFLVDKAKNGVIAIVDLPDYVREKVGES